MTDFDRMDRDLRDYEEERRAKEVRDLMENKHLNEAFEVVGRAYLDAWLKTSEKDVAGRERLHIAASSLDKVKGHLLAVIESGKVAEQTINRFRKGK